MRSFNIRFSVGTVLSIIVFAFPIYGQNPQTLQDQLSPTTKPAAGATAEETATGTETIVFLRHGEKPSHGLGQLTPQGFNRAIALSVLLPQKFGKPDFLFAPNPGVKLSDGGKAFNYVRPLATIEPTAIALEMPVQTPFGFNQIDKLNAELTDPKYAKTTIFVAWEHGYEARAVSDLVKQFGGNSTEVPNWPGGDFDSLYVVKIIRTTGQPAKVTFTHDHEGLDHQSKNMPAPASKPEN